MCQPGRPGPQGDVHWASGGSSALAPFHSAKSRGSRLARAGASVAGSMSSTRWPLREPYPANDRTSKYTSPLPSSATYACPLSIRRLINSCISVTQPVARGSYVGASTFSAS
jgi:hypothetical protein